MREQIRSVEAKGNVTIYLPVEVLERCRAAAAEDKRSLSNYLAGLLERAHPTSGPASIDEEIERARQVVRPQATVEAGPKGRFDDPVRPVRHPVADAVATARRLRSKPKHK
jgi:hypothetical protein